MPQSVDDGGGITHGTNAFSPTLSTRVLTNGMVFIQLELERMAIGDSSLGMLEA